MWRARLVVSGTRPSPFPKSLGCAKRLPHGLHCLQLGRCPWGRTFLNVTPPPSVAIVSPQRVCRILLFPASRVLRSKKGQTPRAKTIRRLGMGHWDPQGCLQGTFRPLNGQGVHPRKQGPTGIAATLPPPALRCPTPKPSPHGLESVPKRCRAPAPSCCIF